MGRTRGEAVAASGTTRETCSAVAGALLRRAAAALALVELWLLDVLAPETGDHGRSAASLMPDMMVAVIRFEAQVALAMAQVT